MYKLMTSPIVYVGNSVLFISNQPETINQFCPYKEYSHQKTDDRVLHCSLQTCMGLHRLKNGQSFGLRIIN